MSLPNGLFPVAAITLLRTLSPLSSLLLARPIAIGIRDGVLFWLFSTRFLGMRCFISTWSLDETLFPLLFSKRGTLRTGILDFCWTGERRFFTPSISLLSRHKAIFWRRTWTTTFSKLSCALLFGFALFWNFSLQFVCEKYDNSFATNLNAGRTDSWSEWMSFVTNPWKPFSIVSS